MSVKLAKIYTFLLLFTLVFWTPVILLSQESTSDDTHRKTGAQYYLGSSDELLMKVNIWGFVRNPGQYLVPTDTDLISLISFAGGPAEEAKIKNIKLIRATGHNGTNGNGSFKKVINVNVEKYIKTGNDDLIPALLPDDTIVISGSTLHFVGKFFDFAAKLAVVAQIYFWVQVANN